MSEVIEKHPRSITLAGTGACTTDHCSTLQSQVAGRIVLQVDKTAFKNQTFYGHKR